MKCRSKLHQWLDQEKVCGRRSRDGQDGRLRGADRLGRPHGRLRAVQHPVGVDGADLAGRRLSVRVEILLRLQPLFAAVRIAAVLRADSCRSRTCRSAATSRSSSCRPTIRPITSSASSGCPATASRCGTATSTSTISWCRASRSSDYLYEEGERRSSCCSAICRDPAERPGEPPEHRIIKVGNNGPLDNTPVYDGAGRPLFRDGRQPRQFAGQPGAVGGRLRPGGEPGRQGAVHLLLDRRFGAAGGKSGNGRSRSATAGCSRASTDRTGSARTTVDPGTTRAGQR